MVDRGGGWNLQLASVGPGHFVGCNVRHPTLPGLLFLLGMYSSLFLIIFLVLALASTVCSARTAVHYLNHDFLRMK